MGSAADASISDAEFSAALQLLGKLIPEGEFPAYSLDESPATVYTNLVTVWMLTLQRLGGGKSMAAIVKEVLSYHRDLLPNNKRVREGTLSENSGSYSQARRRLPIGMVQHFAECVCRSLIEQTPSWFDNRRAYIIDGTTITLSPTSSLRDAYPPAINQHGETVWPIMMLMVAHELQSGCALTPEFGAMYGDNNTSEAKQAMAIARRIPHDSLVLADSNFGIFSVAYAMRQAQHEILFRLSKPRFNALQKKAELLAEAGPHRHYQVHWKPSPKDRQTTPDLPVGACLDLFLHDVELANGERLYLVTSLPVSSDQAGNFYARRYDVEHDIRDLKVSLGLETIRAKSDVMVQKELLCSIVAYNLVVQLRREAARLAKVPPRRLSFTNVWTTLQVYLLHQPPCSAADWHDRYDRALRSASKSKLPNRPGRSYPRQSYRRRLKTTKSTKTYRKTPPEKPK